MARWRADPVIVERMRAAFIRTNADPSVRAKQVASRIKNKDFKRKAAAAGRKHLKEFNADPALAAKREAASKASVPGRVKRNAERLAIRTGVPVKLIPEYRFLRTKKYSMDQAVEFLIDAHPAEFANVLEARRSALLKSLGPMPVAGTHERTLWAKRAEAVVALQSKISAVGVSA